MLLLEHLNLNVPSRDLAIAFYVDGLGGKLNPKGTNDRQVHVNVGLSQFHLPILIDPFKTKTRVEIPQVWSGTLTLTTSEPIRAVRERLLDHPQLRKKIVVSELGCDGDSFAVSGPWGNRFQLKEANPGDRSAVLEMGEHAGGTGTLTSMPQLVHPVAVGRLSAVAAFYSDVLGCDVVLQRDGNGTAQAAITFECSAEGSQSILKQELKYVEDSRVDGPNIEGVGEAAQYHVAVYMKSEEAFVEAFKVRANLF